MAKLKLKKEVLKKEKKGQKIELDNDIDVVFDLNGKFLGIDR